jgi:hypothetical protein
MSESYSLSSANTSSVGRSTTGDTYSVTTTSEDAKNYTRFDDVTDSGNTNKHDVTVTTSSGVMNRLTTDVGEGSRNATDSRIPVTNFSPMTYSDVISRVTSGSAYKYDMTTVMSTGTEVIKGDNITGECRK